MRSRLKTNLKKQNKKTMAGIIMVLILVILFGMKFLIGFSILLEKFKNPQNESNGTQGVNYIAPPFINPLVDATNRDKIDISGSVVTDSATITLYINGKQVQETVAKSDKSFAFQAVTLDKGDNEVKAKAKMPTGSESDYSQTVKIKYLNKAPALEIIFPNDGQTFKKDESPINVKGKSDSQVKVTINDFWTISQDDGSFSYLHNLKDGENTLSIVAIDNAGNKTEKEIKIKVE